MASGIKLKSTNNSEMNIVYQGTSGATRTVVVPDKDMIIADQAESVINLGTAQATTSGTFKDFTIPSGAKRITVMFNGVSTNGASVVQVQLGDSGGIENTGYSGSSSAIGTAVATVAYTSGAGVCFGTGDNASVLRQGRMTISLLSNLAYDIDFTMALSNATVTAVGAYYKTLSSELRIVRITTVNGTDAFDNGTVNVSWEF